MDVYYAAVNVLKAIEVIGTTRVELLNGRTVEKLPGRTRVNRELVRQELAHAGSPDQWKRARLVLEGLGLVKYVGNVGSFLLACDLADAMRAVTEHKPRARSRTRSRKQPNPRIAALCV